MASDERKEYEKAGFTNTVDHQCWLRQLERSLMREGDEFSHFWDEDGFCGICGRKKPPFSELKTDDDVRAAQGAVRGYSSPSPADREDDEQ